MTVSGPTGARRRALLNAVLLAGVVIVVVATGWLAGRGTSPHPPPGAGTGAIRFGPDPGEQVVDYLARLPATLPDAGPTAPALVQFDRELDAVALAPLLSEQRDRAEAVPDDGAIPTSG